MPLDFLLRLLSNLLVIPILGGGAYILYQWYEGELVSDRWLFLGVGLLLWSFLGFLPILLLRRPGQDEPKPHRSSRVHRLTRPDGSEIQVEFYGSDLAPTLILTHGWGPDSTAWYYAKKQLTDQFRVIVWDLPGLGKSKKPNNRDYSLEKYARDLEAVITLAGDQPVVLVGHSMGAMILLTFCRLFPEHLGQRVAGLILVDGTYTNPLKTAILSKLLPTLQKPLLEPLLHLAIVLSPLLWFASWLSYLNGSTLLTTEISGFTGRETRGQLNFSSLVGIKASPGVLVQGVLAMFKFDETATLPKISVPTLVVVGKSDIATRPFASERMSQEVPQAELSILSPGGHMALMERNQQFAEVVRTFSHSCLSLRR
ncbi:alpha/beta hydrolase [Phormidesmis priestleyi ULC007]|uniref:Alpha/beta hydrolase n=1 Tax=Phormidesmis priestleyi ULC007 TaxID=1920490 RepID=A0A2T1DH03_9CYAN|nr:alpha/beta hydrolase [Phormidesmis priestleyi]PSB19772.1 alpha/beta hydrolase [Phormidesmis priestleyi ULC007]PZO53696.1 MAG: alpha/beta hydrolase [Phormidesmis priestleyi]